MVRDAFLKRPILVGGLGLTASLWAMNALHETGLDSATLTGAIAIGAGIWWWRHRPQGSAAVALAKPPAVVDRTNVEAALAQVATQLTTLASECADTGVEVPAQATDLAAQRLALLAALDRDTLRVAIAGTPRTGKTTLLMSLTPGGDHDIKAEFQEWAIAPESDVKVADLLCDRDIVLYLITEDLTESNRQDLLALVEAGHRVLLVFNKQDHYLPDDRALVLNQIRARVQTLPQPVPVAAIAAAPNPLKVRTYQADGQVQERLETPAPDVAAVTDLLTPWLSQDTTHLVLQTVMRQTRALQQEVQRLLNQVRRDRARPIVEQLQWAAAATAFANPVPSLDVLATAAINGQLVMDLGRIYQQPLSLDQAKTTAGTLASLVVKLGLVEVSTQMLTVALKGHAATYVVGGGVQGLSAAYLTHMAGETLMAEFEARAIAGAGNAPLAVETLADRLKARIQATQQSAFLKTLVQQGIQRLGLGGSVPALAPGETAAIALSQPPIPVMAQSETVLPVELP